MIHIAVVSKEILIIGDFAYFLTGILSFPIIALCSCITSVLPIKLKYDVVNELHGGDQAGPELEQVYGYRARESDKPIFLPIFGYSSGLKALRMRPDSTFCIILKSPIRWCSGQALVTENP